MKLLAPSQFSALPMPTRLIMSHYALFMVHKLAPTQTEDCPFPRNSGNI